jgi:23S rRNA (pseudouridine1915-N3)-methyltransferase
MKITILAVGKLKEKYLKDGIAEYAKRLSRFCDFEMIEVADEKAPENLSGAQELQVMAKEADRLFEKVKPGAFLVLLDVRGEKPDSESFTTKLDGFMQKGFSHIVFVIGGSLGVDERLRTTAGFRLSLSAMTLPHQLVRLVLVEQVYRAFKIMRGEPYAK